MKPDTPTTSNTKTWLNVYLALTLGFGFLLFWLLFADTEFVTAARLIFLAVFILTLKRWTGAVLFAFCQLQLLWHEPRQINPHWTIDAFMWSGLSLGMLVAVSRYRALQDREAVAAHQSLFTRVREAINGKTPDIDYDHVRLVFWQLAKCAGTLVICSFTALAILNWFPTQNSASFNSIREYRLTETGYRVLICSISLFCGFFIAWLLVNELCWRKLDARQARIYLHSVLLKFLYRDFRSVTKRRLKRRRKQTKSPHPRGEVPIID